MILAIDPGTFASAWVTYDEKTGQMTGYGKDGNARLLDVIAHEDYTTAVIERIESYGMPVGREVFDTVMWVGRYIEAVEAVGHRWVLLPRREVKLHLCDSPRANDATIRQALTDRFYPGKGTKSEPGPLYGISGDVWAALAVAVTYADTRDERGGD